MIYQGGAWPPEYAGSLFMNNIHGARLNRDVLKPKGSGFVGSHAPDFLLANDLWSQIVSLKPGPDGSMFMIDWYDKNQCHHNDINGHDRTNGRIFKVRFGPAKPLEVDLGKASNQELVAMQTSNNDGMRGTRGVYCRDAVPMKMSSVCSTSSAERSWGTTPFRCTFCWRFMPLVG